MEEKSWADQADEATPAAVPAAIPKSKRIRKRNTTANPTNDKHNGPYSVVYLYNGERRVSNQVLKNFPEYRRDNSGNVHVPDVSTIDFDGAHAIVTGNPNVYTSTPTAGGVLITPGALRILAVNGCDFTTALSSWHSIRIKPADLEKLRPGDNMPEQCADSDDAVHVDIISVGHMYFNKVVHG